MTQQETVTIIKLLKAYYPYFYRDITSDEAKIVIEIWHTHFREFDYDLIKRAVNKWGGEHATAPSLAEFKRELFYFHSEYSSLYSKLINDPKADPEEVKRVEKMKSLTWQCGGVYRN